MGITLAMLFSQAPCGLFFLSLIHICDDRFLDFVVPLSQTSDGTVDDFHVAMVDIGGESPGEVADEESPAIDPT